MRKITVITLIALLLGLSQVALSSGATGVKTPSVKTAATGPATIPACPGGSQATTLFTDNMEVVPDTQFTHDGSGDSWMQVLGDYHSPLRSWFAQDPLIGSDQRLTTAASFTIPAGSSAAYLSFWHRYDFQNILQIIDDGGVVEFSLDGGSHWLDAGPHFIQNGYNGQIDISVLNPLAGRQAFVRDNPGAPNYIQSVADLTDLAGLTLKFRFRLGSALVSLGGRGWNVDDVQLVACTGGTPAPTITATINPNPTDTPILPCIVATLIPTVTPLPIICTPTPLATVTPGGPSVTPTPTSGLPCILPTITPIPLACTPTPLATVTPGGPSVTPTPTSGLPCIIPTITPLPLACTPTPLATTTPGGPTLTPGGPPTTTPGGPTPTDCPNPFVDINNNVFYVAIHFLNCRGVVNGTDPTHYTPAGTSTRAQFAKVVVLGFGESLYTPTGGGQDFTDVPPSYWAYVYIETGFNYGILQGFDQGNCASHNATYPCYLPNIPITRAQLTKLVVRAAGYPVYTPTSGQTFTDVPPSHVFFSSIETAAHKGVVNGYPDHTFRPSLNIRRDEMAQIVYTGMITP